MTPQQIKVNAPEGATHYRPYTGQYLKHIGTYQHIWRHGRWEPCSYDFSFCQIKPL